LVIAKRLMRAERKKKKNTRPRRNDNRKDEKVVDNIGEKYNQEIAKMDNKINRVWTVLGAVLACAGVALCSIETSDGDAGTTPLRVEDHFIVMKEMPHDADAFTQGLSFDGKNLFEGTGLYHKSELRRVDPDSGEVLQSIPLERQYFGEGITFYTDDDGKRKLIQLTWKKRRGWIYHADTFEMVKEFDYVTKTGEGWGITYDEKNKEFIVSDGSHYLMFWDRDTLEEKRRVEVMHDGNQISRLNELEFYKGHVLSNVWYQDVLVKIDPKDGKVVRVYDFKNLFPARNRGADCFNGISITENEDELWVTGKQWSKMFRIKLLDD